MQNIVIFADYGLDDAAATISIFNHSDRFESITVVPIGGNVPAEISYRNCYTLLSYYPELWNKIKVVSTSHLEQSSEYLAEIHGRDGMGDLMEHPAEKPRVSEQIFEKWLEEYTGDATVLSLGPMTLVKAFLEKHPTERLVIMGGVVREEPNFNGYEFNQCLDVEAFAHCVKLPHVAITLDTCRTELLDMRRYSIDGDDLHSKILRADQRLSITRGEDGCYVWDDVAACYILFPERFEVKPEKDPYGNTLSHARYVSHKLYFEND